MQTLWIISELFPPEETSTSYIMGEVANAAAREYAVHVIGGPEIYDRRKSIDREHPFPLDPSIRVIRAKGSRVDKNTLMGKVRSFLSMSLRLYKLARRNIQAGDKVLLVTNPAPLVLLMARLRRRRPFRLTILVHDLFPENTVPAGLRMPAYGLVKRLFDQAYSRADKLLALGRDMADVLKQKTAGAVPIDIVENWADVNAIHPQPFPEGKVKLSFAGNIGRVQGLDKVIDRLPEGVELHFYGTGASEDRLKKKGARNVYFHGPFYLAQQEAVLGAAHASIVSLSDGMYGLGVPSKAYSIMAAGRPILYLGPENGEVGRLVKEHGIGYMGWPAQWDMEEMKAMGARARAVAETVYAKERMLNKLIKALA